MFVIGYISTVFQEFQIDDEVFENREDAIEYRDSLREDGIEADVYKLEKI